MRLLGVIITVPLAEFVLHLAVRVASERGPVELAAAMTMLTAAMPIAVVA